MTNQDTIIMEMNSFDGKVARDVGFSEDKELSVWDIAVSDGDAKSVFLAILFRIHLWFPERDVRVA